MPGVVVCLEHKGRGIHVLGEMQRTCVHFILDEIGCRAVDWAGCSTVPMLTEGFLLHSLFFMLEQPLWLHGSYGRDNAGGRGVAIATRE